MQLNNYGQDINTIFQQFENKSQLISVEKNNTLDLSNNKNTQRDEESKKIENMISSIPSLNNAKEELNKNSNLNKLLLLNLQQGVSYDG